MLRLYLQEVECNAELQRLHAIRRAVFEWHGVVELHARTKHRFQHDAHAHTRAVLLHERLNVIFQTFLAVDGDQTAHVTEHVTAELSDARFGQRQGTTEIGTRVVHDIAAVRVTTEAWSNALFDTCQQCEV
jgi:hypothetical protein